MTLQQENTDQILKHLTKTITKRSLNQAFLSSIQLKVVLSPCIVIFRQNACDLFVVDEKHTSSVHSKIDLMKTRNFFLNFKRKVETHCE